MDYLKQAFGLHGKRVLVTGAGRGIGRAIAVAMAGAGAEVVVHFNKSKEAAEKVVGEIAAAGGKAVAMGADVTKRAEVDDLFARVGKHFGALDVLVNNAGDLVQRRHLAEFDDQLLDYVTQLNFYSVVYACRAGIPLLRKGSGPCIVNVSSIAAHHGGSPGGAVYAATKAAVHTLTRGLAKEVAPDIRVNGISPGVALTDFHKVHNTPENLEKVRQSTPLKRLGTAEDHAGAVVFLASPAAAFMTGETIEINGGLWFA